MGPILCAIDFSVSSYLAVGMALELADLYHAPVKILYSYRLVQSKNAPISEYKKEMESRASKEFEELIKKIKVPDSIHYEFRCEIGFLTDRIEDHIEKSKIGMIVLGQDLANSINDNQEPSSQHFICTANIPILIVPQETTR